MGDPNLQKKLQSAAANFQSGNLMESEALCRGILQRDPWNVGAMNILAGVLRQTLRRAEALEIMNKIVKLAPQVPEVHVNYGDLLLENGVPAEAEASYRRALSLRPGYLRARLHCGLSLERQNKKSEAIQCFEQVVQIDPRNLQAIVRLADNARESRQTAAQARWSELALSIDPDNVEARKIRASAFYNEGRFPEAIAEFRKVLQKSPLDVTSHSALLLALNYDPETSPQALLEEHRMWERNIVVPIYAEQRPWSNDRPVRTPLRIGYVSPDFKEHAVSRFFKPVLLQHDPSQVTVYGYFTGREPDQETVWYKSQFPHWRDISFVSRDQAAEIIRGDAIDILVDLAGHTGNNRLDVFALRPAPLQLTWLGYPSTTGMRVFEYLISDNTIDPVELPTSTVEKIWRLPETFCVFAPPPNTPPVSVLPAIENGFLTFGSLHNLLKLNDRVLDLWCDVLKAIPTSKLLIYRSSLVPYAQAELRNRIRARGLSDDRFRLEFEKPKSGTHFEVYQQIDVHLDSFPWNGHTTTCEALWMGVPTLSLLGNRHAGRMSASMLKRVGLNSYVAVSIPEFVNKAGTIANDIASLSALREQLRARMKNSTLMDAKTFTARLETAYYGIFKHPAAGPT
jgi:predicted O-linked N-acetylglucosamine transferase (SPINDLY family)